MRVKSIITAIAVSLAMAMPVAAHHNCDERTEDCPEEIGDEMEMHEDAIQSMDIREEETDTDIGLNNEENLDPADSEGGVDAWGDDYYGAGSLNQGQLE